MNVEYVSPLEFDKLREKVYYDLPCCELDDSIPDRLSIKELITNEGVIRINPRSVMFPEELEKYYD